MDAAHPGRPLNTELPVEDHRESKSPRASAAVTSFFRESPTMIERLDYGEAALGWIDDALGEPRAKEPGCSPSINLKLRLPSRDDVFGIAAMKMPAPGVCVLAAFTAKLDLIC